MADITRDLKATDGLRWATAFFTVAVLLHNADHVRRGVDALSGDVFWVGMAAIAPEVAVVVLVCQRHRWAPLAAAVAGLSLAAGYVLVHFLPERGWLSDAFPGVDGVSPLSWSAASLEVVAAIALGASGLAVLRAHARSSALALASPAGEIGLRAAILHPLALVMLLGNTAVGAISLTQIWG